MLPEPFILTVTALLPLSSVIAPNEATAPVASVVVIMPLVKSSSVANCAVVISAPVPVINADDATTDDAPINAVFISAVVPEISIAFETVTAADDLPPIALRTVAAILVPASSLTVTVSALLAFASVKVE